MLRDITRRFWINADNMGRIEPGWVEAIEVSIMSWYL